MNNFSLSLSHLSLLLLQLAQSSHGAAYGGGSVGTQHPGTACNHLPALGALPDAHTLALHAVLATEVARVLGVLSHLHLLDSLAQGGPVAGAVLPSDPHLLCALGHGK